MRSGIFWSISVYCALCSSDSGEYRARGLFTQPRFPRTPLAPKGGQRADRLPSSSTTHTITLAQGTVIHGEYHARDLFTQPRFPRTPLAPKGGQPADRLKSNRFL